MACEPVLQALEAAGVRWGIVTNKAARFTEPIVEDCALRTRCAALVCGDTTPHSKPHPAPLLEAARQLGVAAAALCLRGRRRCATCRPAAPPAWPRWSAAWGYLGEGAPVARAGAPTPCWQRPHELLNWLRTGLN